MNSNPDYVEYLVKQKVDTNLILKRSLLVAGIALVFGTLSLFLLRLMPPLALGGIAAGVALVYFFWKYFNVSFEYTITGETFDMDKILSGRTRKKIFSVKISDIKLIAPFRGIFADEFMRIAPAKKYVCCSSLDSPSLYFAVFSDPAHERQCAVFFDSTERTLQLLRRVNPRVVKFGDETAVNY